MRAAALWAALFAIVATACTPASAPADDQPFSRPVEYRDFEHLAADSAAIVRAAPTGAVRYETIGSAIFPVVEMQVLDTLAGGVNGETIEVRTVVAVPGDTAATPVAVLSTGSEWLLFLQPFMLEPGVPTGQWVITADPLGSWQWIEQFGA